jgi:kinesin family member C2/C3
MQFDKVFTPKSTQEEVYEDTKPLVTSCVDGYNVCILAYGQTGSGKTYTMQGTRDDPGVNVRFVSLLLLTLAAAELE